MNCKGLALEDLTCFWFSGIGSQTSHSALRVLSAPGPLACLRSSPSVPKMTLEFLACSSGRTDLGSACSPGSVLDCRRLARSSVLGHFGKGCVRVPGPYVGEVFFTGAFAPPRPSPVGVRGGPGLSRPPPQQMLRSPFCSGPVARRRESNGGICLERCLECRQAPALESWNSSAWERVPEKTNLRSRLRWEKACVRGGSVRDLGRGLAGLDPCLWRV